MVLRDGFWGFPYTGLTLRCLSLRFRLQLANPRHPFSGGRATAGGISDLPFCKRRGPQPTAPHRPVKDCVPHSGQPFQDQFSVPGVHEKREQCPFSCCSHCIEVCALCQPIILDTMCAYEIQCVYEKESEPPKTTLDLLKPTPRKGAVGDRIRTATPPGT